MSTPYNDQWALERPGHEPPERDVPREILQPRSLRERGRAAQEAARSAHQRRVRKRPRWIDRDT